MFSHASEPSAPWNSAAAWHTTRHLGQERRFSALGVTAGRLGAVSRAAPPDACSVASRRTPSSTTRIAQRLRTSVVAPCASSLEWTRWRTFWCSPPRRLALQCRSWRGVWCALQLSIFCIAAGGTRPASSRWGVRRWSKCSGRSRGAISLRPATSPTAGRIPELHPFFHGRCKDGRQVLPSGRWKVVGKRPFVCLRQSSRWFVLSCRLRTLAVFEVTVAASEAAFEEAAAEFALADGLAVPPLVPAAVGTCLTALNQSMLPLLSRGPGSTCSSRRAPAGAVPRAPLGHRCGRNEGHSGLVRRGRRARSFSAPANLRRSSTSMRASLWTTRS